MKRIRIENLIVLLLSLFIFSCAQDDMLEVEETEEVIVESNLTASKGSTYVFNPSEWGIKQGSVSKAEALKNRQQFELAIEKAKESGASVMEVGKMDAYFGITTIVDSPIDNFYPWEEGITLPSNFHLKLSDDTHMRVYPNSSEKYALIGIYDVNNTTLSGGHLYGDREKHNYSGGTHEWGHLVVVRAANNVTISNVEMREASGDGMKIESHNFYFADNYMPSTNITVTGCTFDINRRNNLSITGGEGIIVENSKFFRAGYDMANSQGTKPKFQIDVEAFREVSAGKLIEYEKVDGVIIRNNYERDGLGGFLVSIGENVTIEENDVQSGIAYNYAIGAVIRNNVLNAENKGRGMAIKGGSGDTERISDNKVYGNVINNYATGIMIYSQDHEVYGNKINNCEVGITGKNMKDSKFYNNVIKSNTPDGRGIVLHATDADNVEFKGNTIETSNNPIKLSGFNRSSEASNYRVTFRENNVFSPNYKTQMAYSKNVDFIDNHFVTGNDIRHCEDFLFESNIVDGSQTGKHTFEFRGECAQIKVFYNDLIAPEGYWATHEHDSLADGAVIEKGNKFSYR